MWVSEMSQPLGICPGLQVSLLPHSLPSPFPPPPPALPLTINTVHSALSPALYFPDVLFRLPLGLDLDFVLLPKALTYPTSQLPGPGWYPLAWEGRSVLSLP